MQNFIVRPYFFLVLGALLSSPLRADRSSEVASTGCDFDIICRHSEEPLAITFRSASKNCLNDDSEAYANAKNSSKRLDLPPNYYFPTSYSGNLRSRCAVNQNVYPMFQEGNDLLMFLRSSGRPGLDDVYVALISTDELRVVDLKKLGTSLRNPTRIRRRRRSFDVRLVRGERNKPNLGDTVESLVEGWRSVRVIDRKIETGWR